MIPESPTQVLVTRTDDKIQIVRNLLKNWRTFQDRKKAVGMFMFQSTTYENVGILEVIGMEDIHERIAELWGFEDINYQIMNIAHTGDIVMCECIERRFLYHSLFSTRKLVSVFEFHGDGIILWRDYHPAVHDGRYRDSHTLTGDPWHDDGPSVSG